MKTRRKSYSKIKIFIKLDKKPLSVSSTRVSGFYAKYLRNGWLKLNVPIYNWILLFMTPTLLDDEYCIILCVELNFSSSPPPRPRSYSSC